MTFTPFDFYTEEAKARGITRAEAKMRILTLLYDGKPENFEYEDTTEAKLSVVHPDVAMKYLLWEGKEHE